MMEMMMAKAMAFPIMALMLATATPATAEGGPSYEETVAFLQEKLNTSAEYHEASGRLLSTVDAHLDSPSKCVLSYSYQSRNNGESPFPYGVEADQFNVGDIDSSSIDIVNTNGTTHVNFNAIKFGSKIRVVRFYSDRKIERENLKYEKISNMSGHEFKAYNHAYGGFAAILFPQQENARRVQKAFTHLVKLCGGKPELF